MSFAKRLPAASLSLPSGAGILCQVSTLKAGAACVESTYRSHFNRNRAVGFVNFRPLDRGFRPLVSQSRKLLTMVGAGPSESVLISKEQLSGRWRKNAKLSDDTHSLYEYAALPWMLRKGERFLRYLELDSSGSEFRRTINAGGFLNVSEIYPWNGKETRLRRRDMRGGTMEGRVEQTSTGVRTLVTWGDPHGLTMEDDFCLSEDGAQLTVYTTARRPSRQDHVTIKQIFNKI